MNVCFRGLRQTRSLLSTSVILFRFMCGTQKVTVFAVDIVEIHNPLVTVKSLHHRHTIFESICLIEMENYDGRC